jgi:hypothetical protein
MHLDLVGSFFTACVTIKADSNAGAHQIRGPPRGLNFIGKSQGDVR